MNRWLIRLTAIGVHIAVALIWTPDHALLLFAVGGFLAILAPDISGPGGPRDGQPPIGF